MRLSFQTVLLIFGVTLAHLVAIAALSPPDGEMEATGPFVGPVPAAEVPEVAEEATPSVTEAVPDEPVDLPARRRDSTADPVADAPSAQRFTPLPRS